MPIVFHCTCGQSITVPDHAAGRQARCTRCNAIHVVPDPVEATPVSVLPGESRVARFARNAQSAPAAAPIPVMPLHTWRDYLYWALLLTIVPLIVTAVVSTHDVEARFKQTIERHPELEQKIKDLEQRRDAKIDDFFNLLPDHRIEGALLSHDSWAHWWMALASSAGFFVIIAFCFPRGTANPLHLLYIGLFTGTLGVIVLLILQYMPFVSSVYTAALDPHANFFVSWFGFTFGVGFCEEVIKALPILWYLNRGGKLTWRQACLWGLASGAGFGVSEGIHYAGMYNGVMDGGVYVERFISCVALHVMFSGAAAIMIWKHYKLIVESGDFFNMIMQLMAIIAVPMFSHGLYDTLLKKEMIGGALLVDLFAFAWLTWQIESMRMKERTMAIPKPPKMVWNGRGWVRAGS